MCSKLFNISIQLIANFSIRSCINMTSEWCKYDVMCFIITSCGVNIMSLSVNMTSLFTEDVHLGPGGGQV